MSSFARSHVQLYRFLLYDVDKQLTVKFLLRNGLHFQVQGEFLYSHTDNLRIGRYKFGFDDSKFLDFRERESLGRCRPFLIFLHRN